MQTTTISCKIDTTNVHAKLGLELWLDKQKIFDTDHVCQCVEIQHEFDDSTADHVFKILIKNKTKHMTKVDSTGSIVQDARLIIQQVTLDEIDISKIFFEQATYIHDFNGTQPTTVDKVFGEVGCNGVISLQFRSPVYMWLLDSI